MMAAEAPKFFIPIDTVSQGRKLFDGISQTPVGTILGYDIITQMMGYDIRKKRTVIYATNKILMRERKVILVNIPRVGYKVATPTEQMIQASTRPKRAKIQIRKGLAEATNVNTHDMSLEDKENRMRLMLQLQNMLAVAKKKNREGMVAHKQLETQIDDIKTQLKKLDAPAP